MVGERSEASQNNRYYQIVVEGRIDSSWVKWLGNFHLVSQKKTNGKYLTMLSGVVIDQAALRGLVNNLWNLNLALCSIQQIDPPVLSKKE